jgi:hypothetical protein
MLHGAVPAPVIVHPRVPLKSQMPVWVAVARSYPEDVGGLRTTNSLRAERVLIFLRGPSWPSHFPMLENPLLTEYQPRRAGSSTDIVISVEQLALCESGPPANGNDAAFSAHRSARLGQRTMIGDIEVQRRVGRSAFRHEWTAQPMAESSKVAA